MKLVLLSLLFVGCALAAPAEPSWRYSSGDFNDTNATAPHKNARRTGHADLSKTPVWSKQFRNTSNTNSVGPRANVTVPVPIGLDERRDDNAPKRESDFPQFGAF